MFRFPEPKTVSLSSGNTTDRATPNQPAPFIVNSPVSSATTSDITSYLNSYLVPPGSSSLQQQQQQLHKYSPPACLNSSSQKTTKQSSSKFTSISHLAESDHVNNLFDSNSLLMPSSDTITSSDATFDFYKYVKSVYGSKSGDVSKSNNSIIDEESQK